MKNPFAQSPPFPCYILKRLVQKTRNFSLEAVESRELDAAGILSLSLLLNVFSFCLRGGTKGM